MSRRLATHLGAAHAHAKDTMEAAAHAQRTAAKENPVAAIAMESLLIDAGKVENQLRQLCEAATKEIEK